MGASDTFEHRRTELALLQGAGGGAVDDEEVFASFVSAAQSGGAYHNYIMHAQLAAVWGNTLFIHGGMTALSCGYVLPYELRWKVRVSGSYKGLQSLTLVCDCCRGILRMR